ncbi:MAG: endolytic transglycosylase MltG [Porticoccaceae bacterium]
MFYRLTFIALCGCVVVLGALASFKSWLDTSLDMPVHLEEDSRVIRVQAGSSLSLLSRQLAAEGVTESPYPLLIHARLARLGHIKSGEYEIRAGDSVREFLGRLVAGDVIKYRITFPEGRSLHNWLDIINGHPRLAGQEPLSMDMVEARFSPPYGETLEGWFFPETYVFTSEDSGLGILDQAHGKLVAVLEEEWAGRSEGLPIATPYEALILASIIEKETGVADERGTIAGVFVRRLQQGMRLQTDPTVIYGLGTAFQGNLTRQHLREENPYNTYYIQGLPPTPITNPGREAIHAALHPREGTELYFVAKGDGSHQFSTTLAQHQEAVRQYQLQRVKNYRSSPR